MSFTSLSSAIETVVSTVTDLVEVNEHPASPKAGYPAASIFYSGVRAEVLDTKTNQRDYVFTVRIINQYKDNPEGSEGVMREVAEKVLNALDKSDNLGGVADFLFPVPGEGGFINAEGGAFRFIEIDCVCRMCVDLDS